MPGASSALGWVVHVAPSVHPGWADILTIWSVMEENEAAYLHSASMLDNHPGILPRSRARLLACMMAISAGLNFVKETYFLAVDLHDRFLLGCGDVSEGDLPLLGTTALFLAAKVEEEQTTKQYLRLAGADISKEMLVSFEKMMLKVLDWKVHPVTVISWAKFFLQVIGLRASGKTSLSEDDLTTRYYSQEVFCSTSRLLDICMLDISSLSFQYSVLAACAVCHTHPDTFTVLDVILSRVDHTQFSNCWRWMKVFADLTKNECALPLKREDDHLLQQYSISLLLDKALDIVDSRA